MIEAPKAPKEFEELASLVKASFPNIMCLRCQNDEFYVSDQVSFGNEHVFTNNSPEVRKVGSPTSNVITLACTRCGHIEQHLKGILVLAAKPIVQGEGE